MLAPKIDPAFYTPIVLAGPPGAIDKLGRTGKSIHWMTFGPE